MCGYCVGHTSHYDRNAYLAVISQADPTGIFLSCTWSDLMSFYQEAIIQQISEIERMYQIMNSQMEGIQQIKTSVSQKEKVSEKF